MDTLAITCLSHNWLSCVLHPNWHKINHFGDVLPRQSLGLVLKNWNKQQQKQTCIHNKIYYDIKLIQKIKPGLVASYDIRPGNRNLSLTYLLRHLPTYLQPLDPHGASLGQNLIRSSVEASEYSLYILSKLFKPFTRYRGNSIGQIGQRTDKCDSPKRSTWPRLHCLVVRAQKANCSKRNWRYSKELCSWHLLASAHCKLADKTDGRLCGPICHEVQIAEELAKHS